MRVYVHLLTWNGYRYLPDFFESLSLQTYQDITLRILDNGSTDGTIEYIRQHYPKALVGHNVRNLGFAKGHNQLMDFTMSRLGPDEDAAILYVNQDLMLEPDAIENMVEALELNPAISAIQPKLYRAFGEVSIEDELVNATKSDILDTTGLLVKKGWRMVDRGAGALDKGQYDHDVDIIAPTGTIGLFRASAVKDLIDAESFFDEAYFSYKEDCDLALRFAKLGLKALFVPNAIAYHHRGVYGPEESGLMKRMKNHRSQNAFLAALSTRNHFYTLIKHLDILDIILYSPWLFVDVILRAIYVIMFEPQGRRMLFSLPASMRSLFDKRRRIKEHTFIKGSELRQWVI